MIDRFESDEEEENELNPDQEAYNGLKEYVSRLEQSQGANSDEIYMEINCYRMAINCEYSDILRV